MSKKIFYALSIFMTCFFISKISYSQVRVIAPITTNNAQDTYPTHYDTLGYSGYMTFQTITNRNNIPNARRSQGMLVYVVQTDSLYQLQSDLITWKAYKLGQGQVLDTTSLSNRINTNATNITTKLNISDTTNKWQVKGNYLSQLIAGGGILTSGDTITNTAPDKIVSLTGTNGVTISGTYPTFNISGPGTSSDSGKVFVQYGLINVNDSTIAVDSTIIASKNWVNNQGFLKTYVKIDTTSLSNRIDTNAVNITNKLNITDTVLLARKSGIYPSLTSGNTQTFNGQFPAYYLNYNNLSNKPTLFSGSYHSLTDTPFIPTNNNQLPNGAGYFNSLIAGAGISVSGNTITNTAPNQIVSLTGVNGITISGTYPSFTITGQTIPKYLSKIYASYGLINVNDSTLKADTTLLSSKTYVQNNYQSKGTYLIPLDTASLSNRINTKQDSLIAGTNITIAGNVISGATQKTDTTSLSNRINTNATNITSKLNITDTTSKWQPLGNYKMNYDSLLSSGYVSHIALNDSLNKIVNTNLGNTDLTNSATLERYYNLNNKILSFYNPSGINMQLNGNNNSFLIQNLSSTPLDSIFYASSTGKIKFSHYVNNATEDSTLTVDQSGNLILKKFVGGGTTIDTTSLSNRINSKADTSQLFSGSYNDLTNKPTLFSGSYTDLTNKPTLFSGSYNDLTNKPVIPAQVNLIPGNDINITGNYPNLTIASTQIDSSINANYGLKKTTSNANIFLQVDTTNISTNYYVNSQGFLKSYTETDPIWNAAKSGATTITGNWNFPNGLTSQGSQVWTDSSLSGKSLVSYDANYPSLNGGFIYSYYNTQWLKDSAFTGYGGLLTFGQYGLGQPAIQFQFDNGHGVQNGGRLAFRTWQSGGTWNNGWDNFHILASQDWVDSLHYLNREDFSDSLSANALNVLFPLKIDVTNKNLSADTTMKDSSLVNYRQMEQYVNINAIINKLNISDTAFMLFPYTKKGSNISQFANDARYIDSAGMKNLGNSDLTINEFRDLNLNGYGLTIDDSLTSYNPPRLFISATQSSLGAYAFNNQGTSLDLLNTGGRLYHVNPSSNNTAYQFSVSDTGWSFETNYMHILDINDSGILRFSQPRYEAATGDSSSLGINDQGQLIKLPVLPSLQGQNISTFNNDVGYYKPSDTTSTLGTKYYINSQGFLKSYTETDPVWNAAKNGNTTITGNWNFNNTGSNGGISISTYMPVVFSGTFGASFLGYNFTLSASDSVHQILSNQPSSALGIGSTGVPTLYFAPSGRADNIVPSFFTQYPLATQSWVQSQNYLKPADLHDSLTQNALDVLFPLSLNATNKTLSADTTQKDSSLVNYRQMKQYVSTSAPAYTLPTASTTTLGGVKVDGTTVTINGSGVISAVAGGSGTVTSVGLTGSNGINVSGSPVTTSGTISVSNDTANVIAAKKWVRDSMMAKGTSVVNNVYGVTPISVTGNTNQPFIHINQATTSTDGYLSSIDWNTFNGKKSNSDSTSLIGYVSHNALNDTLAGKIIMNTPTDSMNFSGSNLGNSDLVQSNGIRTFDLHNGALQILDSTINLSNPIARFSNNSSYLSITNRQSTVQSMVSLSDTLSPEVTLMTNPSTTSASSGFSILTVDSSGMSYQGSTSPNSLFKVNYNGNVNVTGVLVATGALLGASASITNNLAAGGIITAKNLSATGQLSIADTVVTSNFTISSIHSLYICNSSSGITATLSTTDPNWNGSPFVIIKNIGTGAITLTNTWTSDPTTIAAGASEILAMVDISGTTYWVKLN